MVGLKVAKTVNQLVVSWDDTKELYMVGRKGGEMVALWVCE